MSIKKLINEVAGFKSVKIKSKDRFKKKTKKHINVNINFWHKKALYTTHVHTQHTEAKHVHKKNFVNISQPGQNNINFVLR